MAIYLKEKNVYLDRNRQGIGANSLNLSGGATFLKRSGNVISQATTATDRIIWVNVTEAVFASDNETVAKAVVHYVPKECDRQYIVTISWGSVTVADEGKFFNLSTADTVNGASVSTTPFYVNTSDAWATVDPVVSMQLELVEFVSATKWIFRIINL